VEPTAVRFSIPGYYVGDCRQLLAELPEESIDCVVTSPPYWGLRDYGVAGQLGLEAAPEAYVAALVDVFRGVRRVLKSDGTLWLNLGDSYCGAPGGSQGKNGDRASRTFTAKSDFEKRGAGLKPKDLVGIPWRVALALQADGWFLRSDIIWHKPNPMPESVRDRPTKAHEYLFFLTRSTDYHYDGAAVTEPMSAANIARYRYKFGGAKAAALKAADAQTAGSRVHPIGERHTSGRRNARTVWTVATEKSRDAHFATFPRRLVEPCILAGCPIGGLVLDPFGGSGTVGRVAEDCGRRWLLFDINPAYEQIAAKRMAQRGLGVVRVVA
jgi:DNA modification methylase